MTRQPAPFREGDRVRCVARPPNADESDPQIGECGWILAEDPPGEWIIDWDRAGTAIWGEEWFEKVGQRNEPDPMRRLPGDPFEGHAPRDPNASGPS